MAVTLALKVKPGARRPAPPRWTGDVLEVAVNAPPIDGKANEAVIRLLADTLGIAKSRIEITSGAGARHKRICIDLPQAQIEAWLATLAGAE